MTLEVYTDKETVSSTKGARKTGYEHARSLSLTLHKTQDEMDQGLQQKADPLKLLVEKVESTFQHIGTGEGL